MKICAAQTRPIKGNIPQNIETHKKLVEIAISNQVDIIIFPELSLTGYEPELADELSTSQLEDNRLNDFQLISNENNIIILGSHYDELDFSELNISGKYRKIIIDKETKTVEIKKSDDFENLDIEFPIRFDDKIVFRRIN